MTNKNLNTYGMFKAVYAVYLKWLIVIMTIPALAEMFELFKTKMAEIKTTSKALKYASKGNVANKNKLLMDAIQEVLPVKGVLKSYAAKSGNEVLLAKVKVSESELTTKLREDEVVEKLNAIMDEARANPEVMAKGNYTTEKLDEVQAAIDKVEIAENSVDTGTASASSLRKKEAALVKEVAAILKEHLDELMPLAKKEHLDLFDEYTASRVIKDLGGKQKQPADEEETVPPAAAETPAK